MTREEREAAIEYIKTYRKLDEDLHNTAPKDSISYYATDKCLEYWDMAIQALSQEPCERFEWGIDGKVYKITKAKDGKEICQQVCDDAISREKTLEPYKDLNDEDTISVWLIRKNIEQQPSVTQKSGKWIPVSERLPEEEIDVLVCNSNGEIEISAGTYSTEANDFMWYTSGWRFGKVIAWMPLPKPYEPQESEE